MVPKLTILFECSLLKDYDVSISYIERSGSL